MTSADGIAAAFPHKILKKINGTPSRIDIDDAQEKQTENVASRPSTRGGGAHGDAGMVVTTARYVVDFSPTAYAWEPIPGEVPVYPVGITETAQRLLDNSFDQAMRIYRDESGTHTALKNQLHQKYNPEYCTGVVQPGKGIAKISLMDRCTPVCQLRPGYRGRPIRIDIGNNGAIRVCDPPHGTVPLQGTEIPETTRQCAPATSNN